MAPRLCLQHIVQRGAVQVAGFAMQAAQNAQNFADIIGVCPTGCHCNAGFMQKLHHAI
jgi:hypothetical protein